MARNKRHGQRILCHRQLNLIKAPQHERGESANKRQKTRLRQPSRNTNHVLLGNPALYELLREARSHFVGAGSPGHVSIKN